MKNPADMTTEQLEPYAKEWMRRTHHLPPRAKVLKPCPKCGQMLGARELREHKPRCPSSRVKK